MSSRKPELCPYDYSDVVNRKYRPLRRGYSLMTTVKTNTIYGIDSFFTSVSKDGKKVYGVELYDEKSSGLFPLSKDKYDDMVYSGAHFCCISKWTNKSITIWAMNAPDWGKEK